MCSRLMELATSLVPAEEVRLRLQCSETDFRAYCSGTKEPNWLELERLVALIAGEQAKVLARSRIRPA